MENWWDETLHSAQCLGGLPLQSMDPYNRLGREKNRVDNPVCPWYPAFKGWLGPIPVISRWNTRCVKTHPAPTLDPRAPCLPQSFLLILQIHLTLLWDLGYSPPLLHCYPLPALCKFHQGLPPSLWGSLLVSYAPCPFPLNALLLFFAQPVSRVPT